MFFVHFNTFLQVEYGIIGIAETLPRHDRLGIADQCQVSVEYERQNRVGIRCGDDFDDALVL